MSESCPKIEIALKQICTVLGLFQHPLKMLRVKVFYIFLTPSVSSLFIGLKIEQNEEQGFVWVDGTSLEEAGYTNWKPQQPDNGGGLYKQWCVQMASSFLGLWDDVPCGIPGAFVCQRPYSKFSLYLCLIPYQ